MAFSRVKTDAVDYKMCNGMMCPIQLGKFIMVIWSSGSKNAMEVNAPAEALFYFQIQQITFYDPEISENIDKCTKDEL